MTSCSKLLSAILCSTDRSVQTKELLVMSVSRLRTRSYEIFVRCVRPISPYYIQTTNKTRMLNIDVKEGKYERGCPSCIFQHSGSSSIYCDACTIPRTKSKRLSGSFGASTSTSTKIQQRRLCLLGGQSQPTNGKRKVLSIGESNPGLPRLTRGNSHDKRKS